MQLTSTTLTKEQVDSVKRTLANGNLLSAAKYLKKRGFNTDKQIETLKRRLDVESELKQTGRVYSTDEIDAKREEDNDVFHSLYAHIK